MLSFLVETQQSSKSLEHQRSNPRNLAMQQQWQNYFNIAYELTTENSLATIDLAVSLLMEENLSEFWRYEGSLTTPPCDENVIWTIFKQRIYILEYDFENFRDDIFFESYRGPQPLYYRQVYRSFLNEDLSSIPDENYCPNRESKASVSLNSLQRIIILVLCGSLQVFYRLLNLK